MNRRNSITDENSADTDAGSDPILIRSLATPIGRLLLAARRNRLIRVELPGQDPQARLTLWLELHLRRARLVDSDCPALGKAAKQIEEYFTAGRTEFTLPLDILGTAFQRTVWAVVRTIPFGATRSYGNVAAQAGRPNAVRAVGAAQAANPLPIIVPCHRVIGSDGRLTGYGGGLATKRWLLDHEAAQSPRIRSSPTTLHGTAAGHAGVRVSPQTRPGR